MSAKILKFRQRPQRPKVTVYEIATTTRADATDIDGLAVMLRVSKAEARRLVQPIAGTKLFALDDVYDAMAAIGRSGGLVERTSP